MVDEVKQLNINNFFSQWSQFLDQVLNAKEDPISHEHEATYKAFIEQAQQLNIPKITDNKESISAMKRQMELIKKRIVDEKKFFEEWNQFKDSLLSAKEYPLSAENEARYQSFIQQAKKLNIEQSRIDEMHEKMNEINTALLKEISSKDPEIQRMRIEELEKKVNELNEKLNKESMPKEEKLKE